MKLDGGIVADEIEEPTRAQNEGGNDLARMNGLALTVDDTRLNQGNDPVGEHLGVNAQVAMAFEKRPDRIGNSSDAHLDGRSLLNESGHMFRNLYLHLGYRALWQLK